MLTLPIEKIVTGYMDNVPEYVLPIIQSVIEGKLTYYPQNMLAVAQAAVLTVTACKRIALGQPTVSAPKYVHIDADLLLQNC